MLTKESQKYQDYVNSLPDYLAAFAEPQNYDQYTPENQAVWRYIMRQLTSFFKGKAPDAYFKGLEKAAIPVERIPRIEEMIEGLKDIGWGAICVNGFIPPAAFMEYNANKILPISADMRSLLHLLYTPAPDIVHEAAGHAPIVADPEYTDFLQKVGEYGAKALSNKYDSDVYEAIRTLSIIKEYPHSTEQEIKDCEDKLTNAIEERKKHPLSEASIVSRFHWWTVEYGLLKQDGEMKMYGAGLLSSLGESRSCLDPKVKKVKLSIDCLNTDYDITKEQPQLFYVESSKDLFPVLEELANRMAFRKGGTASLDKAIECETLSSVCLDTGLQISGVWTKALKDSLGETYYMATTGPTTLNYQGAELEGHGTDYHSEGYSSPVGKLIGESRSLKEFNYTELESIGIKVGEVSTLEFQSGVIVVGKLHDILSRNGENILFTFHDCTVTAPDGTILFAPDWGIYDMAIGESIESIFGGPADKRNYDFIGQKSELTTMKVHYTDDELKTFELFTQVRNLRESNEATLEKLTEIFNTAKSVASSNWLLFMELYELAPTDSDLSKDTKSHLDTLRGSNVELNHLINLGIGLVEQN